jgi:hypothetical protein
MLGSEDVDPDKGAFKGCFAGLRFNVLQQRTRLRVWHDEGLLALCENGNSLITVQ